MPGSFSWGLTCGSRAVVVLRPDGGTTGTTGLMVAGVTLVGALRWTRGAVGGAGGWTDGAGKDGKSWADESPGGAGVGIGTDLGTAFADEGRLGTSMTASRTRLSTFEAAPGNRGACGGSIIKTISDCMLIMLHDDMV